MGIGRTAAPSNPILVIGGGPAAWATALTLNSYDLDVFVWAPEPRDSAAPIWETLHPDGLVALERLGASSILHDAHRGQATALARNGERLPFGSVEAPACHVDRARFDDALRTLAIGRGITSKATRFVDAVETSGTITVASEDGKHVQVSWLVDASGSRRSAWRAFGGAVTTHSPPLLARSGLVADDGDRNRPATFDPRPWGWLYRTNPHDLMASWTSVQSAREPVPPEVESLLSRSLSGSIRTRDVRWTVATPGIDARVLPVGDAAGLLDPATGLGLTNAMASGMAAAQTAVHCIVHPERRYNSVERYWRWWDRRITAQLSALRGHYQSLGLLQSLAAECSGYPSFSSASN